MKPGRIGGSTVVDLDRFRTVNHGLRWETGDTLLVEPAARIQQVLRPADVVARSVTAISRLAGDEFLVLCEEVHHGGAARRVIRRVLDAIGASVPVASGFLAITPAPAWHWPMTTPTR